MKRISTIPVAFCAIILASCGKEHKAKTAVKDFISENFTGESCSIDSYSGLDSTTYVTQEMINRMHQEADKQKGVRKGIKYADRKNKKLLYLPVTLEINKEKVSHTFYLTEDAQEIVAFK